MSQQRRRERRRPTINVFPVTAAAYFHTLSFRRFVVTVDVSPPSASKALRQRHAHHPRSRSTHCRAHVPCRMWDLGPRSLVLELVLCFHARLPWTELRCPPLRRLHAQCPWTALRPPLVVRPCSNPMHVIQGSSGLIRGIRVGWHLLLIGWLPDLVAHCHGCFFTLHGPAPGAGSLTSLSPGCNAG